MALISDKVSQNLHKAQTYNAEVARLRYKSDYGHGFLGLFNALFEGRLEEVIRDPGPPYVDEKDIPLIKKTLLQMAYASKARDKIPAKYAADLKDLPPLETSQDSLF